MGRCRPRIRRQRGLSEPGSMSRAAIRELKRRVRAGAQPGAPETAIRAAQDAATRLLERSIAMGHERLALLRLADAMKLGAAIDAGAWRYCARLEEARVR